ncbi:MAG: hypothetical protein M1825_001202 [Sarcosagium campestre]|nr:MAG: hypothetical protein M1825_001202 [Sarcosagium campestre]
MPLMDSTPVTLLDLLSNTLILYHIAPYLSLSTLFSLAATSKSFSHLIYNTPQIFRRVNLSLVKAILPPAFKPAPIGAAGRWQHLEPTTDEDTYSAPLRGIFFHLKRSKLLEQVQTLILDGLRVPAGLIGEIISDDGYRVQILSIREVRNINYAELSEILIRRLVGGNCRIKGLYMFGKKEPVDKPFPRSLASPPSVLNAHGSAGVDQRQGGEGGVTTALGAQIGGELNVRSFGSVSKSLPADPSCYNTPGRTCNTQADPLLTQSQLWADTIQACKPSLAFDAVLCRSPRHNEPGVRARIATFSFGAVGCVSCHSSPEGPLRYTTSPTSELPLLAEPTFLSSSVRLMQRPSAEDVESPLFLRCDTCILPRCCSQCHRWWCEDCHDISHSVYPTMTSHTECPRVDERKTQQSQHRKISMGLCVDRCLVREMMVGAGPEQRSGVITVFEAGQTCMRLSCVSFRVYGAVVGSSLRSSHKVHIIGIRDENSYETRSSSTLIHRRILFTSRVGEGGAPTQFNAAIGHFRPPAALLEELELDILLNVFGGNLPNNEDIHDDFRCPVAGTGITLLCDERYMPSAGGNEGLLRRNKWWTPIGQDFHYHPGVEGDPGTGWCSDAPNIGNIYALDIYANRDSMEQPAATVSNKLVLYWRDI